MIHHDITRSWLAGARGGQLDRAVIVAMISVLVMQMAADQIIDVVSVRNLRMTAVGPVFVLVIVLPAAVIRRAAFRIASADANAMLVHMVAMHVMQVAIVQIIDMTVVPHRCVAAIGAMGVRMPLVRYMLFSHTMLTRPAAAGLQCNRFLRGAGRLEIPYNSP